MSFSLLFLPVFLFIVLRLYLSPRVKYPPGPRPLPLIGNVLDVPVERPEVRFTEWGFPLRYVLSSQSLYC